MKDEEIVALVDTAKTELKTEMQEQKMELLERIEKIETTLLREFRKWAVRINGELKVDGVQLLAFRERLMVVEERLDDLEGGTR